MKFFVIGLGSMGKRRVRCLQALNYNDIVGYDPRADRRQEAEKLYGIKTVAELKKTSLSVIQVRKAVLGVSAFNGLGVMTRISFAILMPPYGRV